MATCPEVREALFLASPSFLAEVDKWLAGSRSRDATVLKQRLSAYCFRMASRVTPFGLFAGYSIGLIGDHTELRLPPLSQYRRRTRLAGRVVSHLAKRQQQELANCGLGRYRRQSSLWRCGTSWHYIMEADASESGQGRLESVESTDYLDAVLLATANASCTIPDIVSAVVAARPDVTSDEALEFVGELIDNGLLTDDSEPPLTGDDAGDVLLGFLGAAETPGHATATFRRCRSTLRRLDQKGVGQSTRTYRTIISDLGKAAIPIDGQPVFHVDLRKPAPLLRLQAKVIPEILRAAETLRRVGVAAPKSDLDDLRERFLVRFGEREVALLEALDDETGLPFGQAGGDASELARGLDMAAAPVKTYRWGHREQYLFSRVQGTIGGARIEMDLDDTDIRELTPEPQLPFPDAFEVTVVLVAESAMAIDRGDFRVMIRGWWGPSGARLLGRFCHDPEMREHVCRHLRAEERLDQDAIFADVVFLPSPRMRTLVSRPVLRQHEIPFLARSGASSTDQIPVSDLYLAVRNGSFDLRSRALGRRVIPRLTAAHNFGQSHLPSVYRLLCALQSQDVNYCGFWQWGGLETAAFLPRVTRGRAVLARATWRVGRCEVAELGPERAGRHAAVEAWRTRRQLPRLVMLIDDEAGTELLLDLDCRSSLDVLTRATRHRPEVRLTEMYPGPEALCVTGAEGRFVHELVLPLVRRERTRSRTGGPVTSGGSVTRNFPPGSEWIYLQLYCGPSVADRIIGEVGGAVLNEAVQAGEVDRWFFIRYRDPDSHLRVRVRPAPGRGAGLRRALALWAASLLERGVVWRVQESTYVREVERYGGPAGIELAEGIFRADSEAALRLVALCAEVGDGIDRSLVVLRSVDALLSDFDLTLQQKRGLMERARQQFDSGDGIRRPAGYDEVRRRCRQYRSAVRQALDIEPGDTLMAETSHVCEHRSSRLRPLAAGVRRLTADESAPLLRLVLLYVHMSINRQLRVSSRPHETLLYDLLYRVYNERYRRRPGT